MPPQKRGRPHVVDTDTDFDPWSPRLKCCRNVRESKHPCGTEAWKEDFAKQVGDKNENEAPKSLQEIFDWPTRHVTLATAAGPTPGQWRRVANLQSHAQTGVELHTHHSGTGNAEIAAKFVWQALTDTGD